MPASSPAETIARFFAAIRAMNMDAWVSTFDEEAVSEDPVGSPQRQGHDALRSFFLQMTDPFHRVGVTEDGVFLCGNRAAVKWTGYGVGKNGREVTFEGIDVFEFGADGLITRIEGYWDPARVLGVLA
jgi:steroid delta-isomerase